MTPQTGQNPTHTAPCAPALAVVLVAPQLGENIGSAARALGNFAIRDLRLVAPRDGWPNPRAEALSAGALEDGVVQVQVFQSLEEAVADRDFLMATTARARDMQKPVLGPRDAAAQARRTRAPGILFGGEASGLSNDAVAMADVLVTYPVNPAFSSLNLAQAVAVFAHQWRANADAPDPDVFGPQDPPATKHDLNGLVEHLCDALHRAGFFHVAAKEALMRQSIRAALSRGGLTEQEVRTLRGAVKALEQGPRRHDPTGERARTPVESEPEA